MHGSAPENCLMVPEGQEGLGLLQQKLGEGRGQLTFRNSLGVYLSKSCHRKKLLVPGGMQVPSRNVLKGIPACTRPKFWCGTL